MASPRRTGAAIGAAFALSIGLYRSGAASADRVQTPSSSELRDLASITQLQTIFDGDREKVRVLLLLSPT